MTNQDEAVHGLDKTRSKTVSFSSTIEPEYSACTQTKARASDRETKTVPIRRDAGESAEVAHAKSLLLAVHPVRQPSSPRPGH